MSMNKRFPSDGFSLVELLAVLAVLTVLSAVAAPTVSSLVGASGPARALTEAAWQLEHARQSAMRLGTWVWVGIADTTALSDGVQQLTLVAVASRDGSDDLSEANLIPLGRAVRVAQAGITVAPEDGVVALGPEEDGFSFQWKIPTPAGPSDVGFTGTVVGFSPRGEAVAGPGHSPQRLKLSFVSPVRPTDVLSLLVDGPSGQVIVTR